MFKRVIYSTFLLVLLVSLGSWRDMNQTKPAINSSMSGYEMRKKHRIDQFDFSGSFPNLDHIDIDGSRLKKVELDLSGEFPVLETLCFEGSFGMVEGALTGAYPLLEEVEILCGSSTLDFDLRGKWEKDCVLHFSTSSGNVTLTLPEDVGVIVNTQTKTGKVVSETLKKESFWSVWRKTYKNDLYDTSPTTLTINVEVSSGLITIR